MAGRIRKAAQSCVDAVLLRLSKSTRIDGLWLGAFCDEDQGEVLVRVQNALALIKAHDAKRYQRAIASFDRIWVFPLFGPVGQYVPEQRRCLLDPVFVLSSSVEVVASTLVHEATHARLINAGIPYTYENRHRVEKACIRQELVFACRVPGAEDLRRRINEKLLSNPEFWSREASAMRFREAYESGGGLPKWLRRRLSKSA